MYKYCRSITNNTEIFSFRSKSCMVIIVCWLKKQKHLNEYLLPSITSFLTNFEILQQYLCLILILHEFIYIFIFSPIFFPFFLLLKDSYVKMFYVRFGILITLNFSLLKKEEKIIEKIRINSIQFIYWQSWIWVT